MEDTTKLDLGQLDAVLDVVAEMAAAARGDASGLLDVVARIDGLCDQLTACGSSCSMTRTSCASRA